MTNYTPATGCWTSKAHRCTRVWKSHPSEGLAWHLHWARERRNWTLEQWKLITWFDGSRFLLHRGSGRIYINVCVQNALWNDDMPVKGVRCSGQCATGKPWVPGVHADVILPEHRSRPDALRFQRCSDLKSGPQRNISTGATRVHTTMLRKVGKLGNRGHPVSLAECRDNPRACDQTHCSGISFRRLHYGESVIHLAT
ncbi:hypothetical protein DPEC_G00285700 [Dallia pectoralis]|uniref:Uncharacterized protein n=1 Tax=Dallia pectoralis TaxID=75939 RepID=A0ACC2FJP3_DALPE|nr:hypothetical protein DPEC_G00285700 [Dallia pectoralis]